jgi:quinohemoprotein ethanol dehydrogenase
MQRWRITTPAALAHLAVALGLACGLCTSSAAAGTEVNDAALRDQTQGENWLAYGRNYSEQRYSPLEQVNADNVGRLGLAWSMALPEDRSLLSTPLIVDGVMYFTGSWSKTRAVDARTGKLL